MAEHDSVEKTNKLTKQHFNNETKFSGKEAI
jgi:hypothetical protein